ncbi:MAG: 23S rRNA (adenine(2503)-C(2))-methyltransferase RlmN [Sandaracinaceae bacterium]|nr:23S rRNA (adenine(2503)-C(2))-methyltransferase RlmN [Sandaracinaceae bacterium]
MVAIRPTLAAPKTALERLPEEWADVLVSWGEPKFRGIQVFRWIHQRGVFDPAQMTDLPKSLRERLAKEDLALPMEVALFHRSSDGTRKMLLRLTDGKEVESVLIPQGHVGDLAAVPDDEDADVEEPRARTPISQCISTQVGCAMGCVFCASGVAGLKRHMNAGEIVSQVLLGRARSDEHERVRNVVFMGMGEPLHNYDAVARALVLLTHPEGLALSTRRVTLSTSGLVPQIDRLGQDFGGQVQLAVSLHAVDNEKRSALMPINRKHPIEELMEALRRYPLPKRRRITIEYTLIAGKNDELRDADTLSKLLRGIPVKVNLIPMNPVDGSPLAAPDYSGVDAFQERLRSHGVAAFVRRTRGDDIAAACGQLALHGEKRRLRVDYSAGGGGS